MPKTDLLHTEEKNLQKRMRALIKTLPDKELDATDVQSLCLSLLCEIDEEEKPSANLQRVKLESLRLLHETVKTKNKIDEGGSSAEDDILIALRRKK